MDRPLRVGAVMYDPKVSVIGEIIRDFLRGEGLPDRCLVLRAVRRAVRRPAHREMMDLEGLKQWLPGRTSGFGPLAEAVESERFFEQLSSDA